MLQAKDIKSVEELKKYFSNSEKMVDHLIDLLQFFEFKSISKRLNAVKKRGYCMSGVFSVFVILPFLHHASVHALFKSGSKGLINGGKDVYYRFKNREDTPWRKLLMNFVKRFIRIVVAKGEEVEGGKSCLIIDDSLLAKTGRKIEFVSRLWDHVTHRSLLGLRLLLLCYYDGKSTLPVDFSLHREKGKNAGTPYGLKKKHLKEQCRKSRTEGSEGYQRAAEADESKAEVAVKMLNRAFRFLKINYVLMDSWFTSERMIECVRGCRKQNIHLIGMMRMSKAKYEYKGKYYDAKSLLRSAKRIKKITRCRKLKSVYVMVDVLYKGYPVRLYFSRFGKRGKWHLILSTDRSLSYVKMMELYQIRWTIEVFFKESKQFLNLGACQSNNFDAQIADTTITMIQYILLTLKKRFDDYETRGAVFRDIGEQMCERKLHVRLWELLVLIMKTIIETFNIIVDDIDLAITKIINQNKLKGILESVSLKPQEVLT
jgi:hypothetical protein